MPQSLYNNYSCEMKLLDMVIMKLGTDQAFAKIVNRMFIAHIIFLDEEHTKEDSEIVRYDINSCLKSRGLSKGVNNEVCLISSNEL